MEPLEFDNDNDYLRWMSANPSAFVVNVFISRKSKTFILHKANCTHITTTVSLKPGAYTERNNAKICADSIGDLSRWFLSNYSKFDGEFYDCKTCKPRADGFFNNPLRLFAEEVIGIRSDLLEGTVKQITVNKYERNPIARKECLDHFGYSCSVCDTDFEKIYGLIGRNFIHVHHLNEISKIKVSYKINPITDLIPVCPNCHAMLHQKKDRCFTIKELKKIMLTANANLLSHQQIL